MAEAIAGIVSFAGTIESCIRYGKLIVKAYKDYSESDIRLNEISVRIEVCWSRISGQLEVTQQLESSMTDDQKGTQLRVLRILQGKLEAAATVVSESDKFARMRVVQKLHYLTLRENLEATVVDLEAWQKRFEPAWYQFIKAAPPAVDGMLRNIAVSKPRGGAESTIEALKFRRAFDQGSPAFISEQTLKELNNTTIRYCAAVVGTDLTRTKHHVIDTTSVVKLKDARELAYRLRDSNPLTFGILRCKGLVRIEEPQSIAFVFRVPDGYSQVRSVRDLLLSGDVPESLTMRLEMARQMIAAVYYVHLYDFVHKNISPETLLNLGGRDAAGTPSKALVCLVGFQVLRYAEAKTNVDSKDRKNSLYQHPSRWNNTAVDFIMQHDIYSLGVCLLEIGLWESLITYTSDGQVRASSILELTGNSLHGATPEDVKDRLVALSRGMLRARMGDVYSRVVQTCLTCLDDDNTEFGSLQEFQDADGVEVGSRYVRKIMETMSTIVC